MNLWHPEGNASLEGKAVGVWIGIVVDNNDPENLGRVKLEFPSLGTKVQSAWAPVASFWAGKNKGAYVLPDISDEVLVAFREGNPAAPYVIGILWNGVDNPPVPNVKRRNIREFRTANGSVIQLDETKGKEKIEISDAKKNSFVIDTAKNVVRISSSRDLVLSAASGKITLDASEVLLNGKRMVKAEGTSVQLQGKMVKVKGAQIDLGK